MCRTEDFEDQTKSEIDTAFNELAALRADAYPAG
jgi:hypothetical protein